jgi:hypothetical protein
MKPWRWPGSLGSSRARASRTPAPPQRRRRRTTTRARSYHPTRPTAACRPPTQDGMACANQSASLRTRPSRRVSASTEQGAMGAPCRLSRAPPWPPSAKGALSQVCLPRQKQSATVHIFLSKAFLTLWRRTAAGLRAKEMSRGAVLSPHQRVPPQKKCWGGGNFGGVDTAVSGWEGAHPCTRVFRRGGGATILISRLTRTLSSRWQRRTALVVVFSLDSTLVMFYRTRLATLPTRARFSPRCAYTPPSALAKAWARCCFSGASWSRST